MRFFAHHVVAAAMLAVPAAAADAATVREATVEVVYSPGACDVSTRIAIDTSDPSWVDHRLMLGDEGRAPSFVVTGAVGGETETIGRTARVPVSLTAAGRNEYEVRYRFRISDARTSRCPLLVPSAPTDGLRRAVVIEVKLPHHTRRLPGEFPAFTWEVGQGSSPAARLTLAHIPSFVRVPYANADEPLSWRDTLDLRRLLDIASLFTIAAGTVAWMSLRRRTRS